MKSTHLRVLAPTLLSCLLLAACGGGSDLGEPKTASTTPMGASSVRLEGCVVNAAWMGTADVAVHVHTASDRDLGTVLTDARGVFSARVPARTALVVSLDATGPMDIALDTGDGPVSLGACLPSDS